MPWERALFVNLLSGTLEPQAEPASSVLLGVHGPLTLTFLICSLLCWQRLCEYREREGRPLGRAFRDFGSQS